jgi:hypothetical protein
MVNQQGSFNGMCFVSEDPLLAVAFFVVLVEGEGAVIFVGATSVRLGSNAGSVHMLSRTMVCVTKQASLAP